MSEFNQYFYDEQLRQYLIQFMSIFGGMSVKVGKNNDKNERLISVPIKNASMDRTVATIKAGQTQNQPIRLPLMTAWISGIDIDSSLRKGVGTSRRQTVMTRGGVFPTDLNVVEQRMPVPYRATFELGIWASNQDQHYQILEQILMLFNPTMQIQISDDPMDAKQITSVELTGIRPEENLPVGTDRRIIQTVLEFQIPIYLSVPAAVHDRIVEQIFIRIGAIASNSNTTEEIIADLNQQGIEYDLVEDYGDVSI